MREPSIQTVMQTSREPIAPDLSIEEYAREVAAQRAATIAVSAAETTDQPPTDQGTTVEAPEQKQPFNRGGAFGGALKRRIEATNSAEKQALTNDGDLARLAPKALYQQLFETDGDRTYKFRYGRQNSTKVLLTPAEYIALTLSPRKLAGRIGGNVLAHTTEREASERHASEAEKIETALISRHSHVVDRLASLKVDEEVFEDLIKEMAAPGYAHMGQEEMDGLMAHAEGVFVDMFEAITTNHSLGTEMVKSLTAALDYLLSKDAYKETFTYWKEMSKLGLRWTRLKAAAFKAVKIKIDEEYESRFGHELSVAS